MKYILQKKNLKNKNYNVFENDKIIFGFTEDNFDKKLLTEIYKPSEILELKQTHSDIVFLSSDVKNDSKGDGIILDQKNKMAIIRTADCTPLFFFSDDFKIGGIIHIGWRGLLAGIENKIFKNIDTNISDLHFFFGPSIEKSCYEVGEDLYDLFSRKEYHKKIFARINNGKYLMDVNLGISLSILNKGVNQNQISYSEECTFCNAELPSYRRNKKENRIYNFMLLKE